MAKKSKKTPATKPSGNIGWHEKLNSSAQAFKTFAEGIKELTIAIIIGTTAVTAISEPEKAIELFEGVSKALESNFQGNKNKSVKKENSKLQKSLTKKSS